jgi:hypothetical protein
MRMPLSPKSRLLWSHLLLECGHPMVRHTALRGNATVARAPRSAAPIPRDPPVIAVLSLQEGRAALAGVKARGIDSAGGHAERCDGEGRATWRSRTG